MNLIELQRSLRQLRLGGIAAVLETRLRQAQSRNHGADRFDLVSDQRRTDAGGASDCSIAAANRPSFATRTRPSTSSTSPSTPR